MKHPVIFIVSIFLGSLKAIPAEPIFEDVAQKSGLVFNHFNGMSGGFHLPEIMGSGAALLDFDQDGDLDIYLVQSNIIGPGKKLSDATPPFKGKGEPRDRLFRNDSKAGNLKFTDVTEASGIVSTGYGMGVASADVNNDGYPDLYVTNLGSNKLFINNGDGSFKDVTEQNHADDPRWSTSASFFDFNRDGWLDIYVANYTIYDAANEPKCYTPSSARDYCGPGAYTPERDTLLMNKGNGVFEDATSLLKNRNAFGPGLGVVTTDLNGDGWLDVYVANDGAANLLWLNKKDHFVDEALMAGVALNGVGAAEAGMGVTAGDFDGDGDDDLFVTHLMDETNTLYVNDGDLYFEDLTVEKGLAVASRRYTAFGTFWFDMDNDGWLDLITLNGAVSKQRVLSGRETWDVFQEPNQLFRNLEGKKFEEIQDPAISNARHVSRGAAFGDIDNDGDTDIVITNTSGPVRLLLNRVGADQNWIGLRLLNKKLKRDMQGARVKITPENGKPLWRRAKTDGSYCSSHDPRVLTGLGKSKSVKEVTVTWPDGQMETWKNLPVKKYTTLYQGGGEKQ